ncbi:hypothetical protein ACHAQA_002622 [Verticillium albo-atrum]
MPLGGSITHGVGSSDGNGYRQILLETLLSHGYSAQMVGSRRTGSMRNNDHEGWRGFRIDQIDRQARRSVAALRPNVLAVNAGSNDCVQDFRIGDVGRRVGHVLEYLWSASPGSTVLLSTLLVSADKGVNARVLDVNEQIRDLAGLMASQGGRVVLVDMQCPTGPRLCDLVDGTHPNDTGYGKMAALWFQGLQEALSKGLVQESRER